jgi:hypothetical protein
VQYAFATPHVSSIDVGGSPSPVHAPPDVALELVTYG